MDANGAVMRHNGGRRKVVVYVLWGGELEEGEDRNVTYVGGQGNVLC